MVFYYSATGHTRTFADILAKATGLPVYALEADLDPAQKFGFFVKGAVSGIAKKPIPLAHEAEAFAALASAEGHEIYLCGPVWAGQPAGPLRYFLQKATLTGKVVHLLLTCASLYGFEKYRANGEKLLDATDCVPGRVEIFIAVDPLDTAIIEEHIRILFLGETPPNPS